MEKSFYRNERIVSIPAFLFWGQGEREDVMLCRTFEAYTQDAGSDVNSYIENRGSFF